MPRTPATPETASFGNQQVATQARQGLVNAVFSAVAGRYDLMNDLMSGGLHRLWKGDLIAALNPPPSPRRFELVDVAAGTGDIGLRFLAAGGRGCAAVFCDINPEMVAIGCKRLAKAQMSDRAAYAIANAERLPFPDKSFDAYTIGFGIRNVTDIASCLAEAHRVLKIGGRFLCLEFSACEVPLLDSLYDFHSFAIIPRLAKLATGAAEPYQYLIESIRKFPNQRRFAEMVSVAGFARSSFRNLSGGIAAIHSGWRL